MIQPEGGEVLYKKNAGIVRNNKHKLLAMNSVPDHMHLFAGLHPAQSISELVRQVEGDSLEFTNSN